MFHQSTNSHYYNIALSIDREVYGQKYCNFIDFVVYEELLSRNITIDTIYHDFGLKVNQCPATKYNLHKYH